MRTGFGYDLHRLEEGKRLLLAGVHVPYHKGCVAHSDGDVLLHALIDALFGAAALGDIGQHFPPGDEQYLNTDSLLLLKACMSELKSSNYKLVNVDATVVLQKPKILPYVLQMRQNLAEHLGLPIESVSVKGKTKEYVDAVGRNEAVEAFVSVLIEKT